MSKLTKRELRRIIKEEAQKELLKEGTLDDVRRATGIIDTIHRQFSAFDTELETQEVLGNNMKLRAEYQQLKRAQRRVFKALSEIQRGLGGQ